jgi:hypothetical protein
MQRGAPKLLTWGSDNVVSMVSIIGHCMSGAFQRVPKFGYPAPLILHGCPMVTLSFSWFSQYKRPPNDGHPKHKIGMRIE